MRNYSSVLADRGTLAAPGFSFVGFAATGIFGRSDGGIGIGVKGVSEIEITGEGKYQFGSSRTNGDYNFDAASSLTYSYCITSAGTNNKNWHKIINTTTFSLIVLDDDFTGGNVACRFTRNGSVITSFEMSGSFVNMYDALYDIGEPTRRFRDSYVINNESTQADTRVLTDSRVLSAAELAAWAAISPKIWNNPGSSLRCGFTGQDIVTAFNAQGLTATNYNLVKLIGSGTPLYFIKLAECLAFEAAYQRSMLLRRAEWTQIAQFTFSATATGANATFTGLGVYNELNFTFDSVTHNNTTTAQSITLQSSVDGTNFGTAVAVSQTFASTANIFGQLSIADPRASVLSLDTNFGTITTANVPTASTQTPRLIKPGGSGIVSLRFLPLSSGTVFNAGIITARGRR